MNKNVSFLFIQNKTVKFVKVTKFHVHEQLNLFNFEKKNYPLLTLIIEHHY